MKLFLCNCIRNKFFLHLVSRVSTNSLHYYWPFFCIELTKACTSLPYGTKVFTSRPYPFKFFKGYLPQILLRLPLNTLCCLFQPWWMNPSRMDWLGANFQLLYCNLSWTQHCGDGCHFGWYLRVFCNWLALNIWRFQALQSPTFSVTHRLHASRNPLALLSWSWWIREKCLLEIWTTKFPPSDSW